MTEQTGLNVAGYKTTQSSENIASVNFAKELEERCLRHIEKLRGEGAHDGRLLALAFTGLQDSFMWLTRAVFQPGRVALPEDAAPKSVVLEEEIKADLSAGTKNFVAAVQGTAKSFRS